MKQLATILFGITLMLAGIYVIVEGGRVRGVPFDGFTPPAYLLACALFLFAGGFIYFRDLVE